MSGLDACSVSWSCVCLVCFITFLRFLFWCGPLKKSSYWVCYKIVPILKMFWFFDCKACGNLSSLTWSNWGHWWEQESNHWTARDLDRECFIGQWLGPVLVSLQPLNCEFHKCFQGLFSLPFFWPTWVGQDVLIGGWSWIFPFLQVC